MSKYIHITTEYINRPLSTYIHKIFFLAKIHTHTTENII